MQPPQSGSFRISQHDDSSEARVQSGERKPSAGGLQRGVRASPGLLCPLGGSGHLCAVVITKQ